MGLVFINETYYVRNENKVFAYARKGAKPVLKQPSLIHRVLRCLGFGSWVQKPHIEWVEGYYERDKESDFTLNVKGE